MQPPLYVNLRYWFYPIGNTTAINFLRDTRCEGQQTVKILSLGCGDPRNILFTLWSEYGSADQNRYEITTCDIDPAVIARNVVLFTLVMDQISNTTNADELTEQTNAIWNIFYHFFIPDADLSILQDHAEKLLEASKSLSEWMSSRYGKSISFLSQSTLARVRECWSQYAAFKNLTASKRKNLEQRTRAAVTKTYRDKFGGKGILGVHAVRSVGPYFTRAFHAMSSAFEEYWKTGVVGGNEEDRRSLGNGGKGRVNPMFTVSSAPTGDFAVHYASDPLLGFHLAEAFDTTESEKGRSIERVVRIAKSQFRSWCDIFRKTVQEDRVEVILLCGDAIGLGHELQHQNRCEGKLEKTFPLRIAPWKAAPLLLDGEGLVPGPVGFDIIDTSNLADHVGLLTLLPATVPLLRRKSSSVLYIETLLLASKDPHESLRIMLNSDVSTMSLLLGLAPVGHLLGVTTDSVGSEAFTLSSLGQSPGKQSAYRIRTSWKIPELGDMHAILARKRHSDVKEQLAFDAEALADFFFSLYLKMFAYEDWGAMMSSASPTSVVRQMTTPLSGDLRYYTRLSLVTLLHHFKTNVITDWNRCMARFVEKVTCDRKLPVGSNSLQELLLHLYRCGVWEDRSLKVGPADLATPAPASTESKSKMKIILEGENPPSVVHVALVVPRSKLQVFTGEPPDEIGTPGLHLSISDAVVGVENSFFAIQCFFGKLKPVADDSTLCDVEEDGQGWAGSGDLVVTCPIPAYTLLLGKADDLRVALVVNTNPSTVQFTVKLGLRQVVYECGLKDKRLWILREAPGMTHLVRKEQPQPGPTHFDETSGNTAAVHVEMDNKSEVRYLRFHSDFVAGSGDSKSLASGAKVIVSQQSPCTMTLQIGSEKPRTLVYPFPVNGTAAKTKIARKSSWIEVAVPVAPAKRSGGYGRNIFPVVLDGSNPIVWGLSRVNLVRQVLIKPSGNFDWLAPHMGFSMSAEERVLVAQDSTNRPSNGLLDLKESLNILFQSFVGLNESTGFKPIRGFRFSHNNDSDTIILANGICHDENTNSIYLDAYAIVLTHSRIQKLIPALQTLYRRENQAENLLSVIISDEESVLWKQLMPCLVERCRYTWTHRTTCEYLARNAVIPLSTAHGESPICSCGEGKALDGYPARAAQYKGLAPYATRIAIPPISAVPYVEPLISDDLLKQFETFRTGEPSTGSQEPGGAPEVRCDHCGTRKRDLKACGRCRLARYCNHDCQKAAWKEHKTVCKT